MAQLQMPPIPYKMYRHFAVVTLVVTLLVALIMDGEGREAAADSAVATAAPQPRPSPSSTTLRQREPQAIGRFSDDVSNSNFGEASDRGARRGQDTSALTGAGSRNGNRPALPGFSQDYLDSLSDEDYEALVESLRESGLLDPQARGANLAELERQSRARSGRATQFN